jgi:hypothetical protein
MGPKVDPREIIYTASVGQYGISITIAFILLYLSFRLRNRGIWELITFNAGMVVLITSPWISVLDEAVIGAYPTIDKQGSLLFYLDGVHSRVLLSPIESFSDPAFRLIGFHLGHFWIVEIFDVFLTTYGAYNAQMMLNLFLNCLSASLLFGLYGQKHSAKLLGILFGMQLHVFRDIHWYTIEKSSIYCVIFFWWYLEHLYRGNTKRWWVLGPLYLLFTWINFYWGIILAILGFLYGVRSLLLKSETRYQVLKGLACCIIAGIFIAYIQLSLMSSGSPLGSPDEFSQRAVLDTFSLFPLDWNRMGFWQPINPIVCILAIICVLKRKVSVFVIFVSLVFASLSLGPFLIEGVRNPWYVLFAEVPGLWRFAKPEIFFLMTYTGLCIAASKISASRWVYTVMGLLWIIGLYSSKAYPYLSMYIPAELSPDWYHRIFQQ